MEQKISVIVPIYKVERYLPACIDSILAQTHTDLEIILVDDGSPDGCPAICDEYAARDSRIVVIHQKNGGLSAARNAGLDAATGDYIGFVDSDDMISPDMYEFLISNILKEHVSLSACTCRSLSEDGTQEEIAPERGGEYLSSQDAVKLALLMDGRVGGGCTNRLYSRDIIGSIRFQRSLVGAEDACFLIEVIIKSGGMYCGFAPKYKVRQRQGSITRSGFNQHNLNTVDTALIIQKMVHEQMPVLSNYADYYLTARILYVIEALVADRALRKTYRTQYGHLKQLLRAQNLRTARQVKGRKFWFYAYLMQKAPPLGYFLYFRIYCAILKKS